MNLLIHLVTNPWYLQGWKSSYIPGKPTTSESFNNYMDTFCPEISVPRYR